MEYNDEAHAYAFGALRGAYRRHMGWNQFAAANRHGYMPDEYEYIANGMHLFIDSTTATTDVTEAKAIIDVIIVEAGRSIMEQVKGHFVYPTNDEGEQYVSIGHDVILDQPNGYTPEGEELTLGGVLPYDEPGYAEFEDAEEMKYRLRVLAERLRPDDMVTLMSYVDGEYDTLTEACGGKAQYNLFTRRMKVAPRGMVMA